jgi:hypothetical protein
MALSALMEDKRLVNRLTAYWEELRKKSALPQYSQIDSEEIADMWAKCFAWKVDVGSDTNYVYSYVHVGEDIKKDMGMDPEGVLNIEQFRHFPGARIIQKMLRVVESKTIVSDEVNFITDQNQIIKCRTCMVPFGNKMGVVTHVVMGVSSRAFD